jgi:hypothetical protein
MDPKCLSYLVFLGVVHVLGSGCVLVGVECEDGRLHPVLHPAFIGGCGVGRYGDVVIVSVSSR